MNERDILIRKGCCEIFDKMIDCYNEHMENFKKVNNIDGFYFKELYKINIVLLGSLIEKFMSNINDAALIEMKSRKLSVEVHNEQLEMIKNMMGIDLCNTLDKCLKPLEKEMADH